MGRMLSVMALAGALGACAAVPPPALLLEPECPTVHFVPPPTLTCHMAVRAALDRAGVPSRAVAIEFHYGNYCPPGQFCVATVPDVGYVVFRMGREDQSGDVFVRISLEEDGGPGRDLMTAKAGPPGPFPPE